MKVLKEILSMVGVLLLMGVSVAVILAVLVSVTANMYTRAEKPVKAPVYASEVTVTSRVKGLEVVRNYGKQEPSVIELHRGASSVNYQGSYNKVN